MLDRIGPADGRLLDQLVHGRLVLVVEGRYADDHLVDEHAERPPVQRVVVAAANDHLGRDVLWRAAETVGHAPVFELVNFSKAEVREQYVAVQSEQDIFWL